VAITPTVLIAAQGMMSGEGIGVNADMSSTIGGVTANPLASATTSLTTIAGKGWANVAGLSDTLSSLPSAVTGAASAAASAATQAAKMAPDVKTFITAQSSASSFGAASAEYSAALAEFGNKSFGDLGVGVKNLVDANSSGLTAALPGLGALANKAKADAFGGLGNVLDPTALAKGAASLAGSSIKDGLGQVASGLKNFGNLFDFKNPQSLGAAGLIKSLQQAGLADSLSINDAITARGFDPKNLAGVPDSVIQDVLGTVTGSDLQKIISQTGVKPIKELNSAADLLDVNNLLPAGAIAGLGLKMSGGGLAALGNTFTNLGVPMDAASAANLMNAAQTKVGPYLSGLTELIPASVKSALGPMLGAGSGLFGNPTMNDMMGSLAGTHTDALASVGKAMDSITTSPIGQSLNSAMTALQTAIASGTGIDTALTALQNATSAFNVQALGNADLKSTLSGAASKITDVSSHISLENSNLALGGLNLDSIPASAGGMTQIMGFASKLHSFGVDKQMLGHTAIFEGAASEGLTGDAIKASLDEGKNIAKAQALGMPTPTVANEKAVMATAANDQFDGFVDAFKSAKTAEVSAWKQLQENKKNGEALKARLAAEPDSEGLKQQLADARAAQVAAIGEWNKLSDAARAAREKMLSASYVGGAKAMDKATAAMQSFQS
jgi:hypothetical protein